MRIGLNCLHIIPGKLGGLETYMINLLDDLRQIADKHQIFVFCAEKYESYFRSWATQFQIVPLPVNVDSALRRIFYEQMRLRSELTRYGIELLHSSGYTSPVWVPCRKVVTVHDLNYLEIPSIIRRSHGELRYQMMRLLGPYSMKQADAIIAVSGHVAQSIQSYCAIPADRVHTLLNRPPGDFREVITQRPAAMAQTYEPYLLYVASWFPHKNHRTLLRALEVLADVSGVRPLLVLAGLHLQTETAQLELRQMLMEHQLAERTLVINGHLPLTELAWLYRNARCFVFPSLFEGFGIPVLEAMSAGTPVLCADRMPMKEVAGEGVVYFDPQDASRLARLLGSIWEDEKSRCLLAAKGRERYEQLNSASHETSQRLDAIYRATLAKKAN